MTHSGGLHKPTSYNKTIKATPGKVLKRYKNTEFNLKSMYNSLLINLKTIIITPSYTILILINLFPQFTIRFAMTIMTFLYTILNLIYSNSQFTNQFTLMSIKITFTIRLYTGLMLIKSILLYTIHSKFTLILYFIYTILLNQFMFNYLHVIHKLSTYLFTTTNNVHSHSLKLAHQNTVLPLIYIFCSELFNLSFNFIFIMITDLIPSIQPKNYPYVVCAMKPKKQKRLQTTNNKPGKKKNISKNL